MAVTSIAWTELADKRIEKTVKINTKVTDLTASLFLNNCCLVSCDTANLSAYCPYLASPDFLVNRVFSSIHGAVDFLFSGKLQISIYKYFVGEKILNGSQELTMKFFAVDSVVGILANPIPHVTTLTPLLISGNLSPLRSLCTGVEPFFGSHGSNILLVFF